MAYMMLNKTYSVGMHSIDAEHGALMDLINRIHEANRAPASPDEIRVLFRRLAACAAEHFWQEESLFAGTGYPDAALHARKHEHLLKVLSSFQSGIDRMGRSVPFDEQLGFVRDWLLNHIANEDQEFAGYLNAQERSVLSAVA